VTIGADPVLLTDRAGAEEDMGAAEADLPVEGPSGPTGVGGTKTFEI